MPSPWRALERIVPPRSVTLAGHASTRRPVANARASTLDAACPLLIRISPPTSGSPAFVVVVERVVDAAIFTAEAAVAGPGNQAGEGATLHQVPPRARALNQED